MLVYIRDILDNLLRIPKLKGFKSLNFDETETTEIQKSIFKEKKSLHILYDEYCRPFTLAANKAPKDAVMIEVGSGSVPLSDYIDSVITTDIIKVPWLDAVCSAYDLPFKNNSVDYIFLLFTFHHLGRAERFLEEVYRCLKKDGELIIMDMAVTPFSKFYFKYIHIDSIDTHANAWGFSGKGRLSDSNVALAWIVFIRDRKIFNDRFPDFHIKNVEYNTFLSYLLSGGFRIRQLLPTPLITLIFMFENWVIRHITNAISVSMAITISKR